MDYLRAATVLSIATMGHSAAQGGVVMERPPFYENQIRSATKIVTFFRNGKEYVILHAQMQSGKSDTFMLAGAELVRLGLFDKFVVVSANADRDLGKQTKDVDDFSRRYRKYLREVVGLSVDVAEDTEKRVMSSFSVYWGHAQLKKAPLLTNTLVIVDESHYGQREKQSLDKFFKVKGLQPNGDASTRGNKMLSVSATPFSERLDNESYSQNKGLVIMEPGDGYIGIGSFVENNCFVPYTDSASFETFRNIVRQLSGSLRNKAIVRVKNEENARKFNDVCISAGISSTIYTADNKEDIKPLLSDEHARVIIVLARMRMGYVIPDKSKISFIFEAPISGKGRSDTLLQGLAGRMCGYPSTGASTDIKMYVPLKLWEQRHYQEYAQSWATGNSIGCAGPAMCVRRQRILGNFVPTIPEKVTIDLSEWDGSQADIRRFLRDTLTSDQFRDSPRKNLPRVINNLRQRLVNDDIKEVSINNILKPSYAGHERTLETHYHNGNELSHDVGSSKNTATDGSQVRFWFKPESPLVDYSNMSSLDFLKQCKRNEVLIDMFVQFRRPFDESMGDTHRHVTTTKKEIFAHRNEEGVTTESNGGAIINLSPQTANDVDVMRDELSDLIRDEQITCVQSISRDGTSGNYVGIYLTQRVWDSLREGGEIYEYINANFGRQLVLTKSRGRRPANFPPEYAVRLSSIAW